MNKKKVKQIAKQAALGSLTIAGKIIFGMFELVDNMNFLRSHQNLCAGMSISEDRAYLAETEAYRKEYRRAFNRLENCGLIENRRVGGRMMAILTDDGEVAALEIYLKMMKAELTHGECWMITFDFPVVANKARDMFRRFLIRTGFNRHQQSVWCTKKDVGKAICRVITILKIEKWVRLYRATEYR